MSTEQDLITLRGRVAELERRLDFIYKKLGIEYFDDPGMADSHIISLIKSGKKLEAIKAYRSQFYKQGSSEPPTLISSEFYFDFLKGRWGDFGKYIGVKYAEGYVLTRPAGVDSITDLF